MRILYLAPPLPHCRKFVETFSRDHEVLAVTQFRDRPPGWEWLGTPGRFARWIPGFNVPALRRTIERFKPDLLHAFHLLPTGYLASLSRFRPLVISPMGADVYLVGGQISRLGEVLAASPLPLYWHVALRRRFDLAIAECAHVVSRMEWLGYEPTKLRAIPWGPDCSVFTPDARDEKLREMLLAGSHADTLLISTRTLRAVYGVDRVIRALPRIPESVRLVVCGAGPDEPRLRGLARRLDVGARIHWSGALTPEEMPRYLASSDIAISLARSDTVSVAILEAMACGLPVVVRDVGGTGEFVTDGESGLLLDDGEPRKAADAVRGLAEVPAKARRMGAAAREKVRAKADWRECSRRIEKEYEKLAP